MQKMKSQESAAAWTALCAEYGAVFRKEAEDQRHGGNISAWRKEIDESLPIQPGNQDLTNAARDTGDIEILKIVYIAHTPMADTEAFKNSGPVDPFTFEAMCDFSAHYRLKPESREIAILLRHALDRDDMALLKRVERISDACALDEQDILNAWRAHPDLLEWTGPRTADAMAQYIRGWAEFSPAKLLSVFLEAAKAGHAKSVNAVLASGFPLYETLSTIFGGGQSAFLHDPDGDRAVRAFPSSFRDVLKLLQVWDTTPNHHKMKFPFINAPASIPLVLAAPRDARFNNIAASDWLKLRAAASAA